MIEAEEIKRVYRPPSPHPPEIVSVQAKYVGGDDSRGGNMNRKNLVLALSAIIMVAGSVTVIYYP